MNKKSIENEAKRISNELLKKNKYNESFDNLISSLINKKYINNISQKMRFFYFFRGFCETDG